jgi:C4-dicarboxylate transporter, DctM subunit
MTGVDTPWPMVPTADDADRPITRDRPRPRGWSRVLTRVEDGIAISVLAAMAVIPLVEMSARAVGRPGVPGAIVLVQHLTLWIALLGAALAARSDRLLALSTMRLLSPRWRVRVQILTGGIAAGIAACLFVASVDVVRIERMAGGVVAWGIPTWAILSILPIGFAAVAGRLVWHAAATWQQRSIAALGLIVPLVFSQLPAVLADSSIVLATGVVIVAATALGMPIFAAIGGFALLLLWADGTSINAVPGETYRLTTSTMLPAIPLFALTGYILAEGGSSRRLTRLFTSLVGWIPGGLAIVVTAVLAFFTPLTGASGITIVAMGGLLLPMLHDARYPRPTSLGLVTVSGSIGLLFFPSLPVFLYAFYANQQYERMFIGGLLPGVLLVVVVAGWAAARGWAKGATRSTFDRRKAATALWEAKWEIGLPVVILGSMIWGWAAGVVEAAALSVLYALVIECVVHRDLRVSRDLPRVTVECATLVGGFLIILSVALGFTNYLVLADVPTHLLAWVRVHIESPLVFLLALNVFLILVGALMDIYSAIVVVVPLVTPIAAWYGIDPVHLGVIFLANMELGYLMPPMGENLFLSAYRFDRPLTDVYRSTLPYTLLLLGAVLLITYVPWLTLWLVRLYDARVMP